MKKLLLFFTSFTLFQQSLFGASQAIVIDKPGVYQFRTNLIGAPTDPNDCVVSIQASSVTFDLEGYSITQDPINTVTGLIGIKIASNLQDVVVKNGIILLLSGTGIIISDGCADIDLNNIFVSNCYAGGILVDGKSTGTGVQQIFLESCYINSCTGINNGDAQGVTLNQCQSFEITGCIAIGNDGGTVATNGNGFKINNCKYGRISNCVASSNGANTVGTGFCILNSRDLLFKKCRALHNRGRSNNSGAMVAGFYANNSNIILCTDCEAIDNVSDNGPSYGYYFDTGTGNILNLCSAQSNQGGSGAAGMLFKAQTCSTVQKSYSNNNQATISGNCAGISLNGSSNDKCFIVDNNINCNSGIATSRGIEDQRATSTSFFARNRCFNNGTNYSITYPLTITLPKVVGSLSNAVTGLPQHQAGDLDNVDVSP